MRWLRRGEHRHRSLREVKPEGFVMRRLMCRVIMDYSSLIRFSL
jgi:hypothetical protein